MRAAWCIPLGLLLASSLGDCFIPKDTEVRYKYGAHLSASKDKPSDADATSAWAIRADLTATSLGADTVLVQLKDPKVSMRVGDDFKGGDDEAVPKEAVDELVKPFVIAYDARGLALTIKTRADDKRWSVDMKKGIASLMQLDAKQLDATATRPYGFESEEYSVYGNCPITYTVVPKGDGELEVEKRLDSNSCRSNTGYMGSFNLGEAFCERMRQSPLSMTSVRTYEIETVDGEMFVDGVDSTNTILLSPFDGKSDGYALEVYQIMEKAGQKMVDETTRPELEKDLVENKLKINYHNADLEGNLLDLNGDRAKVSTESLPDKIIDGFKTIARQLNGDAEIAYYQHGGTAYNTLQQLRLLDRAAMEVLFTKLNNDSDNQRLRPLLIQALPVIGSRTSAIYIRDLIAEKKVSDEEAATMIKSLVLHIKRADKIVLKSLMDLRTVPIKNEELQKAIVLSLGTIVSKFDEEDPTVDTFIVEFIEKFKESFETGDRDKLILLIGALKNMKTEKANDALEELIFNDEAASKTTPQIRSLVIWALRDVHFRTPKIKKYWPLIMSEKENLEVRAAALETLMTSPSMETLVQLYWIIEETKCNELYTLFVTKLQSMAETKTPCHEGSALHARKLLNTLPRLPEKKSKSFSHVYDFLDNIFKFGKMSRVSSVGNLVKDKFISMRFESTIELADVNFNYMDFKLRMELDETCTKKNEEVFDGNLQRNYLRYVMRAFHGGCLKLDMITSEGDHVTSVSKFDYDPESSEKLVRDLVLKVKNETTKDIFFGVGIDGEAAYPTDMGIPTVFFQQSIKTTNLEHGIVEKFDETLSEVGARPTVDIVAFDMVRLTHYIYGMKMYNPIMNTWHGVRRNHVSDTRIPFVVSYVDNFMDMYYTFNNEKDDKIREYKYETNAFSQVFIETLDDDWTRVEKVCEKCKPFVEITEGKKVDKVLWKHHGKISDMDFQLEVFDCVRPLTSKQLGDLKQSIFGANTKSWGNMPMLRGVMTIKHIWAYMTLSPAAGRCGIRLSAKPRHTQAVLTLYGAYLSFGMTFINGDEETLSWKLESDLDPTYYLEGVNKDWTMNVTQTKPTTKLVCLERTSKKSDDLSKSETDFVVYEASDDVTACSTETAMSMKMTMEMQPEVDEALHERRLDECVKSGSTARTCAAEQGHYDRYTYDFDLTNAPAGCVNGLRAVSDRFRETFGHVASRAYFDDAEKRERKAKVVVEYEPFTRESVVDVHLTTPREDVVYEDVALDGTLWAPLLGREGAIVPWAEERVASRFEATQDACEILDGEGGLVDVRGERRKLELAGEWTQLMNISTYRADGEVDARKEGDVLELKIKRGEDELLVQRLADSVKLLLNGKPLENTGFGYYNNQEPWFRYKMLKKMLVLRMSFIDLYAIVGDGFAKISISPGTDASGMCYDK